MGNMENIIVNSHAIETLYSRELLTTTIRESNLQLQIRLISALALKCFARHRIALGGTGSG